MENIALLFAVIVFLSALGLFLYVVFKFLEYCFGLVFEKPFYVHFCLAPKKISNEGLHFLNTQFPFYMRLSDKKKIHFEHRIAKFIDKYEFISRGNL